MLEPGSSPAEAGCFGLPGNADYRIAGRPSSKIELLFAFKAQ
jgi:hypothetical protein